MIKTLLKTLLLLVAVGYFIFAIVKVSRPPQKMVCTGVEYLFTDSGEVVLIDKNTVANLLAQKKIAPKGKTLEDIDIHNIEHLLSESPYIDTVNCYHTATGKLCIRIQARHPLSLFPFEETFPPAPAYQCMIEPTATPDMTSAHA